MFGSHLSISGGLHNALLDAQKLDMDCVQVFTKNQRQWQVKPLAQDEIDAWFTHRKETGIKSVVSHDSYLINLASPPGADNRAKSIALFREEIERCEALKIPYLVTHPGSHLGEGEEEGLNRIIAALDEVHDATAGCKTVTLLEITAGQGTNLGYRFEHLQHIIQGVREPERLAVCLDTAHLLAAGYDLTSKAGAKAVLDKCDAVVGLDAVRCVHMNDSKVARGSRVDRHEHIGLGHVALDAFAVIVNDAKLKRVPKILETAKEDTPQGKPWDAVNLEVLRGLVKGPKRKK